MPTQVDAIRGEKRRCFLASSAEFVGEFGFGQIPKSVIQRGFDDVIAPKSVRLSHGEFCFVVEPLHNSSGYLTFCAKPIE